MSSQINDWHPETASLLVLLRAAGFTIRGGHNGEDAVGAPETFRNEAAFLSELLACDETTLYVTRKATRESTKTPGKQVLRRYALFLVLGNSPGELVADWGIPADAEDAAMLEAAINENYDHWDGRPQPKTA